MVIEYFSFLPTILQAIPVLLIVLWGAMTHRTRPPPLLIGHRSGMKTDYRANVCHHQLLIFSLFLIQQRVEKVNLTAGEQKEHERLC